jgi:hypothetical protein
MKNLQIKVVRPDDKDLMALINELDEELEEIYGICYSIIF